MEATANLVQVAVGVVFDKSGQFLMTTRPPGKAYAGYWEFPGGKMEAGESVEEALARELHEELGITVHNVDFWRSLEAHYPHASVQLHFCQVRDWTGTLEMREGQQASWQVLPVTVDPVLPGSLPVLEWLGEAPLMGQDLV